jgi:hypothetical protein
LNQGLLDEVTLTPYIHTFVTAVSTTGDIYFRGNESDIFIIQIVKHLAQAASEKVILVGDVQAKNTIWQVAGLSRWAQVHTWRASFCP